MSGEYVTGGDNSIITSRHIILGLSIAAILTGVVLLIVFFATLKKQVPKKGVVLDPNIKVEGLGGFFTYNGNRSNPGASIGGSDNKIPVISAKPVMESEYNPRWLYLGLGLGLSLGGSASTWYFW